MSLEKAGEFLLEWQADDAAVQRADRAYLSELESIATEQGFEASADEIKEAMRAIAGLDEQDGDEVEGFGFNDTIVGSGFNNETITGATGGRRSHHGTWVGGGGATARFSPLGFMR